ncbi:hypothetical protein [Arthrobacter sp. NicSoilB8]|uniref:hypothetical protein n=1 Tax=Arthrobacter sp. NicSoilB8 TaxID=2830998 RepID=UPI001CC4394C|nr:hypothetical protein [Arthrobacter sp. NicSoilB8]BCW71077.1 hypothetical protein NicSoilB8_21210 [Arthrobacter sp. NicSoilB8]
MKNFATACAAAVGVVLVTAACAAPAATPGPTTTVTATPPPSVVVFDPQTSGKVLAERIKARAKPKDPGVTISGVECKNFPDIKVNTHTDCQMVVNGVKRGYRATFTERDGHYEIKAQELTW